MDKIKSFQFKDLFKKNNRLFLIGLAGILLIFLSDLLFTSSGTDSKTAAKTDNALTAQAYIEQTEAKLESLIESVEGAGKTKVMITLESSSESIYAVNESRDTQTTETGENDSYQSEHVIIDAENGDAPLIETVRMPPIRGVAVVCEGADDISVQKRIIDLTSVVLGLTTNRICVTKMI